MRVLLIKTSSLGDLLHTLPALSDAAAAIPDIVFDWVVEEAFVEVPAWHPAVDRVIPVAIRRWRKSPLKCVISGEWGGFKKALRLREYDLVLDAQGLIKSGVITWMARGRSIGLDQASAREPLVSRFYDRPLAVAKGEHAITRLRRLFALALGYALPDGEPDSGLVGKRTADRERAILFVHGTTWKTKHWPESYWLRLADQVNRSGYRILLPWGNEIERGRAERIAAGRDAEILPRGSLGELLRQFQRASGAVCVDSGLAHLAAALEMPSITLYGATSSILTGTRGRHQQQVVSTLSCAPCLKRKCHYTGRAAVEPACFESIEPDAVWQRLQQEMAGGSPT